MTGNIPLSIQSIVAFAGGAVFYIISRESGRAAERLSHVKKVERLSDLAKLVPEASSKQPRPVIVAVHGVVGAEKPIKCVRSDEKGAILIETMERFYFKNIDRAGWVQDSDFMLSGLKETNWHLEDESGSRVNIVGARLATGFELSISSEIFQEANPSVARRTVDHLTGAKYLGERRTERVLPIGKRLCVVGELIQNGGNFFIVKRENEPFYATSQGLDELVSNLGGCSRLFQLLSVASTVVGVFAFAAHTIQHWQMKRRLRAIRERQQAAAAGARSVSAAVTAPAASSADGGTRADSQVEACIVCLHDSYDTLFLPCGHICSCTSCSARLEVCPLCRSPIERAVRVYRP